MFLHLILVEFSVPAGVSNKGCLTPVGDRLGWLGFIYMGFLKTLEVGSRCFCSEEIHNLIWGLGRRKLNDSVPIKKNLPFYITEIFSCGLAKSCNIPQRLCLWPVSFKLLSIKKDVQICTD